jgi:hypothetical protein
MHFQCDISSVEFVTGGSVMVKIDLTWESIGPTDKLRERSRFTVGDTTVISRLKGVTRQAEVTGTVITGTTNHTPNEPEFALLQRVSLGETTVIRPR